MVGRADKRTGEARSLPGMLLDESMGVKQHVYSSNIEKSRASVEQARLQMEFRNQMKRVAKKEAYKILDKENANMARMKLIRKYANKLLDSGLISKEAWMKMHEDSDKSKTPWTPPASVKKSVSWIYE